MTNKKPFQGILNKCKALIGKMTIQKKMILAFCFILPTAIFVLGMAINAWMYQYALQLVLDKTMKIDLGVSSEIEALKSWDEQISNMVFLNPQVHEGIAKTAPTSALDRYLLYRKVQRALTGISSASRVTGVYVAGYNGLHFRSTDELANIAFQPLRFEPIQTLAQSSNGKNEWQSSVGNMFMVMGDKTESRPYLYIIREIQSHERSIRPMGISIVQLNYKSYADTLGYIVNAPGEYVCLADEAGTVLVHTSHEDTLGQPLDDALMALARLHGSGHTRSADGKGMILYSYNANSTWTLIHYIPMAEIVGPLSQITRYIWLVMGLSFFVLMTVLILFSRTITKPISKLAVAVAEFGQGDMKASIPSNRQDEIGDLERQFNVMVRDIRHYIKEIEQQNNERTKLELRILENQINPHFLYNTLDLINWRARVAGQNEIGDMTAMLARFFRIGLHNGLEFITVREELEHAQIYIEICRLRYPLSFDVRFEVDTEILDIHIKKILLQPVLENVVKHGIKTEMGNGLVTITGKQTSNGIVFAIRDNGRGISPAQLAVIRGQLASGAPNTQDSGFGLQNLHRRIVMAYGDASGVSIDSEEHTGTVVMLHLAMPQKNGAVQQP